MELSFYTVVSYRQTPVAVVLVGRTGCYHAEYLEELPASGRRYLERLLGRLERAPRWRELCRIKDSLGSGPTQMSEVLPVTYSDPLPVLENLAKRHLVFGEAAAAAGS